MKILYFDCSAGISGDMTVAALLDLGIPLDLLREKLALLRLHHDDYRLSTAAVTRNGFRANHFQVEIVKEQHHHRHYADIAAMIDESGLGGGVKARAQKIFLRLAEAEAKVHGVAIEQVHFHEVGAIDSIIDVVGAAICLDHLGVEKAHASALPYGSGFVETAHGLLPVPAPATAELMQGMAVHHQCGPGERVTPTGTAILAAMVDVFGSSPSMRITGVGSGAGSKEFPDCPNILRVVMGEQAESLALGTIQVIETNIDDMNPEILGFLMERLMAAGALDVAFTPIQMKKNRPGIRLTLLAPGDLLQKLAEILLTESTAAGIRHYPVSRMVLERTGEDRETSLGRVRVKIFSLGQDKIRIAPEYEECRRLAVEKSMPLLEVYRIIEREACMG